MLALLLPVLAAPLARAQVPVLENLVANPSCEELFAAPWGGAGGCSTTRANTGERSFSGANPILQTIDLSSIPTIQLGEHPFELGCSTYGFNDRRRDESSECHFEFLNPQGATVMSILSTENTEPVWTDFGIATVAPASAVSVRVTLDGTSRTFIDDVRIVNQGVCGDGFINPNPTAAREEPEICDDSNAIAGDGCAPDCAVEAGFICDGAPSVCRLEAAVDGDDDGSGGQGRSGGGGGGGGGTNPAAAAGASIAVLALVAIVVGAVIYRRRSGSHTSMSLTGLLPKGKGGKKSTDASSGDIESKYVPPTAPETAAGSDDDAEKGSVKQSGSFKEKVTNKRKAKADAKAKAKADAKAKAMEEAEALAEAYLQKEAEAKAAAAASAQNATIPDAKPSPATATNPAPIPEGKTVSKPPPPTAAKPPSVVPSRPPPPAAASTGPPPPVAASRPPPPAAASTGPPPPAAASRPPPPTAAKPPSVAAKPPPPVAAKPPPPTPPIAAKPPPPTPPMRASLQSEPSTIVSEDEPVSREVTFSSDTPDQNTSSSSKKGVRFGGKAAKTVSGHFVPMRPLSMSEGDEELLPLSVDAPQPRNAALIPFLILDCMAYVDAYALEEEGIYRELGPRKEIIKIRKLVDKAKPFDIFKVRNPHVITGLLLSCLSDRHEPLVTPAFVRSFVEKRGWALDSLVLEFRKAFFEMDEREKALLLGLVDHWARVASLHQLNTMTSHSLAVAVTPYLTCGDASPDAVALVSFLVEHAQQVAHFWE